MLAAIVRIPFVLSPHAPPPDPTSLGNWLIVALFILGGVAVLSTIIKNAYDVYHRWSTPLPVADQHVTRAELGDTVKGLEGKIETAKDELKKDNDRLYGRMDGFCVAQKEMFAQISRLTGLLEGYGLHRRHGDWMESDNDA